MIGMDLTMCKNKTKSGNIYALTVIDYYTKWCEAIPLKSKDAYTVVDAGFRQIFCRFGPPRFLITDNGKEFINQEMDSHFNLF